MTGTLVFIGLLCLALLAERMHPLAGRTPHDGQPRIIANFGLGLLCRGAPYLFAYAGLSILQVPADHGLLAVAALPPALEIAAGVLLLDLSVYAAHRLSHFLPWFWRLHHVHHSDARVDATTVLRNHPLELLITVTFTVAATLIGGVGVEALALYALLAESLGVLHHCEIRWPRRLERLLTLFIVTPHMHRLHHSAWQPETDSNYGALFSFWDRLFGTFRQGVPDRYGLPEYDDPRHASLGAVLLSPFRAPEALEAPAEHNADGRLHHSA